MAIGGGGGAAPGIGIATADPARARAPRPSKHAGPPGLACRPGRAQAAEVVLARAGLAGQAEIEAALHLGAQRGLVGRREDAVAHEVLGRLQHDQRAFRAGPGPSPGRAARGARGSGPGPWPGPRPARLAHQKAAAGAGCPRSATTASSRGSPCALRSVRRASSAVGDIRQARSAPSSGPAAGICQAVSSDSARPSRAGPLVFCISRRLIAAWASRRLVEFDYGAAGAGQEGRRGGIQRRAAAVDQEHRHGRLGSAAAPGQVDAASENISTSAAPAAAARRSGSSRRRPARRPAQRVGRTHRRHGCRSGAARARPGAGPSA